MARRRVASRAAATVLALLAGVPGAEPWGSAGHRLVHRKAIQILPKPLRGLFEANAGYLAEHSIDPDLWRRAGRSEEETSHYLNMDSPNPETAGRLPARVGE